MVLVLGSAADGLPHSFSPASTDCCSRAHGANASIFCADWVDSLTHKAVCIVGFLGGLARPIGRRRGTSDATRNVHVVVLITLLAMVAGCSGKRDPSTTAMKVEVGMTENEVLAIMGPPIRREVHGGTEFLIYSADGVSETAILNFVPIAIVDGRVTGAGRNLYDAVIRAKAQTNQDAQP